MREGERLFERLVDVIIII